MKKCLFCSAPLTRHNRSREHVIPRWLLSHLEVQDERFIGKHWSYPNEPTIIFSERKHDFLSLVLGNACKDCNTGWMAQLEKDTRPLLEALLTGHSMMLTREQCNILARWTFKTAAAGNYSVSYKKIVTLEHIHQFFITGQLPENATVDFAWCYNARYSLDFGWQQKVRFIIKENDRVTKMGKLCYYPSIRPRLAQARLGTS